MNTSIEALYIFGIIFSEEFLRLLLTIIIKISYHIKLGETSNEIV